MSVKNFVQCSLVTPVTAAATQLILNPPVAPYDYPPLTAGTVVIADSVARPSFYEVISYTHRIDNVLYGVTRGKEGTTARNWTGTTWVYQALTAADYVNALALKAPLASPALTGVPTAPTAAPGTNTNQIATMAALQAAIAALVQSSPAALDTLNELAAALGNDPNFATAMNNALAGKEPSIVAGTTAQYWAGNKTWQDLMAAVHGLALTGLGAGSNTAIVSTDTILGALAKIQNQMNNKAASNDSRLTDAREWTATEVTQVEAEAGTATTARKWTAQRVAQAVRSNILTGLNVTVTGAVAATDTLLTAIGKLQKQINDAATNLAGSVRSTALSGYLLGSNAALANTDTVEGAFGKVQAQLNAKLPLTGGTMSGAVTFSNGSSDSPELVFSTPSQTVYIDVAGDNFRAFTPGGAKFPFVFNLASNSTYFFGHEAWHTGNFNPSNYLPATGNAATATTLSGLTATVAELNYVSGVTSNIQTQLNGKAASGHSHSNYYTHDGVNTGWFRSTGTQGWYSETYGGGIYMADSTYVRTYNNKQFLCSTAMRIEGPQPQVQLWDTDHGIMRYLYADGGSVGFLTSGGGWALINDNAGNTTSTGNVTAYSDIRLKKDIELIPDALDKVLSLRGVTYERIDSGERQTGVIAQEVQAVLPEAVMESNDEDKTLSVAYGNMVGLLIEAVKELNGKVDSLQAELDDLRRTT